MPTPADLDTLNGLLKRLGPLSGRATGDLIRAEDWRALTAVLVDLANATLGSEHPQAAQKHEHPDQVAIGWLEPGLRSTVERGPVADPAVQARIGALERTVQRLSARIEALSAAIGDVRLRANEVATRDLLRANEVTEVRRKVEGLSDGRDDVVAVRETLRTIRRSVDTAVAVGERLTVDGQPVDMAAITQRLGEVEALRERLRTPSGELLDAAGLENRLAQLSGTLVTHEQLDTAIGGVHATLAPAERDTLAQEIENSVTEVVNAGVRTQLNELRAETTQRLAGIDTLVSTAVANAVPGVTETVKAAIRPEIAAAVASSANTLTATIDQRVSAATTALRSELGGRLDDLDANLATTVSTEVNRQAGGRLTRLSNDLQRLSGRFDVLEGRAGVTETKLTDLSAQLQQQVRDEDAARANLGVSLRAEMDRRDQASASTLDARLAAADAAQQQRLQVAVADVRRSLADDVTRIANDAASNEVQIQLNRFRGEIHTVARDEVVASHDQISGLIDARINTALGRGPTQ